MRIGIPVRINTGNILRNRFLGLWKSFTLFRNLKRLKEAITWAWILRLVLVANWFVHALRMPYVFM